MHRIRKQFETHGVLDREELARCDHLRVNLTKYYIRACSLEYREEFRARWLACEQRFAALEASRSYTFAVWYPCVTSTADLYYCLRNMNRAAQRS